MAEDEKKKPLTDEEQLIEARVEAERRELIRRARARASDDGDASHQGGMGAQGGQVDFGRPKNYSR